MKRNIKQVRKLALLAGIVVGVAATLLQLGVDSSGNETGIALVPLAIYYSVLGTLIFIAVGELFYGTPTNKKRAQIVLVVLLLLAGTVIYQIRHQTAYCDGLPVTQYIQERGPLPSDCGGH